MEGDNVGQPFRIDVRVTQNGTTGWVIAIAAGLVLIGTTTLRIRTVARERARAQAAAPEETVGAMSSAPAIDDQRRWSSLPSVMSDPAGSRHDVRSPVRTGGRAAAPG